ncbi:MAG: hypothetical protein ACM3QX_05845 [Syntrophomonadaceae bacterium]
MFRSSLNLIIMAVMIPFGLRIFGQNTSSEVVFKDAKLMIEKAYMNYDKGGLLKARDIFQNLCNSDSADNTSLYYLTYIDYKMLEMNLYNGTDEIFDKYYTTGQSNAEKLSGEKDWASEGKTLLSAIYMMRIAKKPMTAVYLSPKIWNLLDEACRINPVNPRVYIIRGSMNFNTPKMFGGSYKNASENFRTAISIFEKQDTAFSLRPDWGYAESLAWFGRSLEAQESYEQARFAYQKALAVEPSYRWVKNVLLPNLEEKMKKGN